MRKIWISLVVVAICSGCRFGKQATTVGADRVVSVSKQLTELLFALHQGDKIVGVDLSSTYPAEATKRTTVGYHRLLNTEGIVSLNPTVVVHQGDVAPPNVMTQLQDIGIPVKVYPAAPTIDSTRYLIRRLGKEFGQDTAADRLLIKLDGEMRKADSLVQTYASKPRVLILHFGRQRNQYFVMGTKGTANELIRLADGHNVEYTSSFRTLSPEVIVQLQPDIILATDFGYDRLGSKEKFGDLPGIALTPAFKNGKIYRVEEHDLVYFGPRSGAVIMDIARLIHQ